MTPTSPHTVDVLLACDRLGLRHEVLSPNHADLSLLVRLDTTDPDVHLAHHQGEVHLRAVMDLGLIDADRALVRTLDPVRRDRATARLLRDWAGLRVQWSIRKDADGAWEGFQISRRVYPELLQADRSTQLWEAIESVVDAGFMVRAVLLELRAETGQPAEPSPLPRVRAAEIVDGLPAYTVVHTSAEAARWIHEQALRWDVATEAVVDRLVAQARKAPLRPDPVSPPSTQA